MIIVFAFMFLFQLIPAPAPVTPYGMAILGIFLGLIWGWCFCDLAWPSLLAMPAIGLTAFGNTQAVFSGVFGDANLVIMLLTFLLFAPVSNSGLSQKMGVALLTSKVVKGRPILLMFLLSALTYFLSLFVNAMIINIFFISLFTDIFKKLGYQKGDRFVCMFFVPFFLSGAAAAGSLPFYQFPLIMFGMSSSVGITVTNPVNYIVFMVAAWLIILVAWFLLMKLLRCDFSLVAKADFSQTGVDTDAPLSKTQKAVGLVLTGFIIGLLGVGIFGKPNGSAFEMMLANVGIYGVIAIAMVLMCLITIDGKPVLNLAEAASAVNWSFIFLLGLAMFMSSRLISEETGISALCLGIISPILASMGEYGFMLLLTIVCIILTNLANNVVVAMTMNSVVIMMVSQGVEINGVLAIAIITFMSLCSGMLLPSSSISGAMIYGNELVDSKFALLQGFIIMALFVLLAAVFIIPVGLILF